MKPSIHPPLPLPTLIRTAGSPPARKMGRTLEQIVTLAYLGNRLRPDLQSVIGSAYVPARARIFPVGQRALVGVLTAGLMSLFVNSTMAQTNDPVEEHLGRLTGSLRFYSERGDPESARTEEPVRVTFGLNRQLTHLAAAPGHAFLPQRAAGQPGDTARFFVQDNKALLGIVSSNIDVAAYQIRQAGPRTYVRLQQTYKGLPVFAGQMAVQLNADLGVEFLSSDLALEVNARDTDQQWATPTISPPQVISIASNLISTEVPGLLFNVTAPQLTIYAPSVFDETGPPQLVWQFELVSDANADLNARWLVDAHSGEVVARFALTHSALNRQIRDSNNNTNWPGTLVRAEGDPATGIADADDAYNFVGQSYSWFMNNHGWDSYNGLGATLNATVRYCPNVANCPWGNAQWNSSSQRMRFGQGYATDDVVGHEFTHAITEFTSGLVYENQSGAINESLSDVFGEFIDLTNANGDDSAGVRWRMGEDLAGGSIRDMAFPDNRSHPDRLGSPFYVPAVPAGTGNNGNDFGGVHSNSGVNNKLCYLLVDGDTFNGWTVTGMGINPVANLYFEANANLLTSGSGWTDLYEALRQASVNLGWNVDQRNNLYRACRAVEIAASEDLYIDWTSNCLIKNGRQTCLFLLGGPFKTVAQGNSGAHPGDRLHIRGGSYDESVTLQKIMTVRSYNGTAVIGN